MAAIGATCGGVSASITRALSDNGMDATRVNQFRFVGAFILLALALRIFAPHLLHVPRVVRPHLLVIGLLGSFGTGLAYIASITLLPIATAQALIYTSPIMLLGIAAVLARRWPSPIALLTVLVAVGGCWMVVNASAGGDLDPLGIAAALIAASSFAAYVTIIGRLPIELPAVTIIMAMFTVAVTTLVFIPYPLWTFDFAGTTAMEWLGLFGVVMLATLVPYLLFAGATLRLPGPVVGVIATIEPVVAVIVAWITLGQSLSVTQIAGVAIVLCAATAAQLPVFTRSVTPAAVAPRPEPVTQSTGG
ncbi:MAG: EamA family transporter [Solirubrobacteraceae bacterium]|nr:EamA family transporter [Solirubrobacteraceae bacterium]